MKKIKNKILLITYACEPNKGSEPGVGWNWAIHLSKFVIVTVITRGNNRFVIEKELKNNPYPNLSFIYFDIPVLNKVKKIIPFGVQLYYLLWEFFVVKKIKGIYADIIQRLTFVSTVSVLRLYKLNRLYIMSFCAGGEITPVNIYRNYSLLNKLKEKLRLIYNSAYKYCSITKKLFDNSQLVIAVTKETQEFINALGYNKKIIVEPAIGLEKALQLMKPSRNHKLVYAGSLIYWKNVEIIIKAIEKIGIKNIEFDIYGKGNEEVKLKKLVSNKLLQDKIHFYKPIPRKELLEKMSLYDLAIHASSHDSGSMFLLEAISIDLPVLFLDTGGPKEIFQGIEYPLKVNPDQPYAKILDSFKERIEWLYQNYDSFYEAYSKVRERILEKYNWDKKARRMIKLYEEILNENPTNS